jgi:hypothetical protein
VDAAAVIETHLPALDRAWRPTVERLVEVVIGALPDAEGELKWGRLTFTRDGEWHHWLCAISPTKKAVKLVLHKGALLDDPRGAMEGTGRYTRSIPFRSRWARRKGSPPTSAPIVVEGRDRGSTPRVAAA